MRSVKDKISGYAAGALLFFVTICFAVVYFCLRSFGEFYQTDMDKAVNQFALSVIEPDSARNYNVTRITDEEYFSTLRKLKDFQSENSNSVNRISLYSFNNSGGICIYDTGDDELGNRQEYDEYTQSVMAELINCRNSWNDSSGDEIVCYTSVRTVDDQPVGYIIVHMKKSPLDSFNVPILLVYVFMMTLSLIIVRVFSVLMERNIFRPIKELTDTSLSFTGEDEDNSTDTRDDEISGLSSAVNKMFMHINSGAENLSRAIFDANHDGMTGTLNKRCYHNMIENFRSCSSICVIYFDVNNLKLMNDTLGHESGDYVIKRAAEYIKELMSPKDYCFRMGGDEFLMVMTECTYREMDSVISRIESESPIILNRDSDPLKCALSYGCSYGKGSFDYDSLLTEAEEGMYEKKAELKMLLQMPER
ncbi:MAG: diguanylate cyclase [Ruminococcus sp.]|nr:diguanylate cyclase [Ruminococcus sp.]